MRLFITGTDTGVGKTHFTCMLLRALVATETSAVGFKPICCGDRADALGIRESSAPTPELEAINPIWLRTPASPDAAAIIENRRIECPDLVARFERLAEQYEHVLVEGAGGWAVPMSETQRMSDLAVALDLPVLLVVDNRLGALNHTLLTIEAIGRDGLTCCGIVLNHTQDERDIASVTNRQILERHLPEDVPILMELLHADDELPDLEAVVDAVDE